VKVNKKASGCFKIAEKPKVEKKKALKKNKTLKNAAPLRSLNCPRRLAALSEQIHNHLKETSTY